jgi:hypothetical protein
MGSTCTAPAILICGHTVQFCCSVTSSSTRRPSHGMKGRSSYTKGCMATFTISLFVLLSVRRWSSALDAAIWYCDKVCSIGPHEALCSLPPLQCSADQDKALFALSQGQGRRRRVQQGPLERAQGQEEDGCRGEEDDDATRRLWRSRT